MFVPFVSRKRSQKLVRRKGRGGGGSKSGGSNSQGQPGIPITAGGRQWLAYPLGQGGGPTTVIPAGAPFAGREMGGGSRATIAGTHTYGSGYPGQTGRDVSGRGFPYYFWPIVWPNVTGPPASTSYLHPAEYGSADNPDRPGGPLTSITFATRRLSIPGVTVTTLNASKYYVVADQSTTTYLQTAISNSCLTLMQTDGVIDVSLSQTRPEETVQYFRASSVAFSLRGYNNSAVFASEGTPDTPLPENIDNSLGLCVHRVISQAVPLVSAGGANWGPPNFGVVGLVWLGWFIASLI